MKTERKKENNCKNTDLREIINFVANSCKNEHKDHKKFKKQFKRQNFGLRNKYLKINDRINEVLYVLN